MVGTSISFLSWYLSLNLNPAEVKSASQAEVSALRAA